MKKILLSLAALSLILIGCGNKRVPFNFYSYRDDIEDEDFPNKYFGDESETEYHLHNWYPSDTDNTIQVDEDPGSGITTVDYSKSTGKDYRFLYTPVCGRFSDFLYINFLAMGTPGKGIAFRLLYGESDQESTNVLGNDVSFSLSEEYEIHSLKVKATYQTRMDLLRKVAIYPEIGLSGSDIRGRFFFKDVYFSKELPENAILENPGVDTGDTSVNVNGWKTDAWTFYSLYNNNGKTGVRYSKTAEWAFIEKDLEIPEDHNALRFTFENYLEGDEPTVKTIRFIVRGDVSRHVDQEVPYEYDEYYEYPIYNYDLTDDNEVQPDEDNVTTLEISLAEAILSIGEHHENGYRLVLMIESHPEDADKYEFNYGEMLIHGFETFYKEAKIDYYSMTDYPSIGSYSLNEKDGVDKNITYEGIIGSAYWPRINRLIIDAENNSIIKVTIRNNGDNDVKIQVHAGVPDDPRSDSNNNMFYPLWNNNGLEDLYFNDGETIDLTPKESKTLEISVDTDKEDITKDDKITLLQFLVDNCYGDNTLRSGNIDIVSVIY